MLTNVQAAIFDLDGTLIDSMWIWEQIDIDYLSSKNLDVPSNLKDEINHLSFKQTALYFKKTFNLEDEIDTIMNTWSNMAYNHYSKNIKLKPGVIEFFNILKSKNIKIGLATSNSTLLLTAALKSTKIYDYFNAITITDEVNKDKSNPDIYLLAAQKLQTPPENCIVFEDIIEAVSGAKKANMKVIGVYDKAASYQKERMLKNCDHYIYDFNDLL